jgi:multidrug efflux system membrane fusion protein
LSVWVISMNKSYLSAIGILGVVAVFFTFGTVFNDATGDDSTETQVSENTLEVVTSVIHASSQPAILELHGRTQAIREVIVRSETGGRVTSAPAIEGQSIRTGELVCKLDINARQANLAQAEALLRARQLDFDATTELQTRGHRTTGHVAAVEAARDAASAQLEAAQIELSHINIRAPFDGYFDDRYAEIGDYLGPGDPCGMVVQLDPILIIAEVAERDVASISTGMTGQARLVTGEELEGTIRFIQRRADPLTHTFRVELVAPNPDGLLRSGVTSRIILPLEAEPAHRVPTSVLALNSAGELGVRIVEEDNIVRFVRVTLLRDDGEQVWVGGLPERAEVIILGQDFVADGARVRVASRRAQ